MSDTETNVIAMPEQSYQHLTRLMEKHPRAVAVEIAETARTLLEFVEQKGQYKEYGNSRYLCYPAWLFLAQCHNCMPSVISVRPVTIGGATGFEAIGQLVHVGSGQQLAMATAYCMDDEPTWSSRPKYIWENGQKIQVGTEPVPMYQRASMAQTRVLAKVARDAFAQVPAFAGFETTPAEEIVEGQPIRPAQTRTTVQQPRQKATSPGGTITEKQQKFFWHVVNNQSSKNEEEVRAILAKYGYSKTEEIKMSEFDAILTDIRAGDAAET